MAQGAPVGFQEGTWRVEGAVLDDEPGVGTPAVSGQVGAGDDAHEPPAPGAIAVGLFPRTVCVRVCFYASIVRDIPNTRLKLRD